MTGRANRGLVLLAALGVAACGAPESAEQGTIDAWLGCFECDAHELDSVLALAGRERNATVTALKDGLLAGPSPRQRQNLERQLDSSYRVLVEYRGPAGVVPQAEFVRRYRDNIIGTYRVRSAVALAHIGGPDVKPALDSAAADELRIAGDSLRPVDLGAVRFARDSIWELHQ